MSNSPEHQDFSYTEVLFKVFSQLFYSICACQLDFRTNIKYIDTF